MSSFKKNLEADPPPSEPPPVQHGMTTRRVVDRLIELCGASAEHPEVFMRTPEGDLPVVGISGEPGKIVLHFEITDEFPEGYE
jgi:hypothetical protein